MPARAGYAGWEYGDQRAEGDGSSPIGMFPMGSVIYGNQPDPGGLSYPYHQLVCGDWWDENPATAQYNTFQHAPCGTNRFGGDSEALWTETAPYPYFAVIDYNTPPSGPHGSGVFLHADTGGPTAGCVSVPLSDLVAVLRWLNPAKNLAVVMGPDPVVRNY